VDPVVRVRGVVAPRSVAWSVTIVLLVGAGRF
jgi:hypothetical protein